MHNKQESTTGDVEVVIPDETVFKFTYYYKYRFTFKSEDGISVTVGGDSNDIYRCDVYPEMKWSEIKTEFDTTDSDYIDIIYPQL